ncbi:MAG: 3-deoxy-7-phosphoheptulonate synthase [Flavobacteriaceae bacterium]|nr:3-deoxy-7-phosphoheptulonate synthase [Flavobacteriaceae bacterium]|tara:strand:- start:940 stop:2022 length:1083 start_codon:yes stop_codon:yes gene_type:complete
MKNNTKLRGWLDDFNLNHPLVIAGPCSAETESQVLQIAHELKNSDVSIFRAGIWKPRTRPGNFEGVGSIGLKWLQKVKQETGLLITTEVANPNHVKLALDHDVDVLWIGARSTVSPFIIQEIADALENTDKIVLLKNPVNPDLSLWYGGIERLYNANIKKLGVIHRGFSTYTKTKFRNNPEWQIPIELQNRFPDLPLICDPSHICGRRDIIQEISQKALDLNFDGLMIETHNDPDIAWSDAAQQITPKNLIKLMKDLVIRNELIEERSFINELENLREKIDDADSQILDILGNRMKVSDEIGKIKKKQNVAILQSERWKDILKKMISDGKEKGLSEDFILKIFKAIHQESINHQEKILKN